MFAFLWAVLCCVFKVFYKTILRSTSLHAMKLLVSKYALRQITTYFLVKWSSLLGNEIVQCALRVCICGVGAFAKIQSESRYELSIAHWLCYKKNRNFLWVLFFQQFYLASTNYRSLNENPTISNWFTHENWNGDAHIISSVAIHKPNRTKLLLKREISNVK